MPPESASALLTAHRVTSGSELAALAPDWLDLWRRCPDANPFLTPAWLLAWWRHLGSGQLDTLVLRTAERRLVALAPFAIQPDGSLQLLGTGVSDYGGALVEPDSEAAFAGALDAHLRASPLAREVDWRQLPSGSPLLEAARIIPGARLRPDVPCPTVTLCPERDRRIPIELRREIDHSRRRLHRLGDVEFITADRNNLDALIDALFALHSTRWADAGGGALADTRVRKFHREAARALLDAHLLRVHALRVGGGTVAIYYGFTHAGRACYYLSGFAPMWRRYGVGHQVIDFALQSAATEGAGTFDFLRGQESYKYRWGAHDAPTWRVALTIERDG